MGGSEEAVVKLYRVVIGSFLIVLATTAAIAQPSGNIVTETVATVRDRDLNGAQRVSELVLTRTTHSSLEDVSPRGAGQDIAASAKWSRRVSSGPVEAELRWRTRRGTARGSSGPAAPRCARR